MDIKQDSQQSNNQNSQKDTLFDELKKKRDSSKSASKKIKPSYIITAVVIIIGLIVLSNSLYIVQEDEVAIVRRLGKISKVVVDTDNTVASDQNELNSDFDGVEVIKDKGLFIKVPFITTVDKMTSKLITYISPTAIINTQDKIKYEIKMFSQWEITHPGLFRSKLKNVPFATARLDEIAYAKVIESINSLDNEEFLTDKAALSAALTKDIEELNKEFASSGIVIKDLEVYRTILPPANIASTHNKMIAERNAIAQQIRSEGMEIYNNTVADTDLEVSEIVANSIEESQRIRGEADATALEIYANGFSKDPEFYEFWRTMTAYEKVITEDTTIYLDSENDFLKYFKQGGN